MLLVYIYIYYIYIDLDIYIHTYHTTPHMHAHARTHMHTRTHTHNIIANEVSYVSNKEHISIVRRYHVFTKDVQIHEDFLIFVECDNGISGKVLA